MFARFIAPFPSHSRILHQLNVLIGIRPTLPGGHEERYPLQILIHAVVNDQMRLRVAAGCPERNRRVQLGYQSDPKFTQRPDHRICKPLADVLVGDLDNAGIFFLPFVVCPRGLRQADKLPVFAFHQAALFE